MKKYILVELENYGGDILIKYFDDLYNVYAYVCNDLTYDDMDIEDFNNPPYSGMEERLIEHVYSYYLYKNGEEDPLISLNLDKLHDGDSWENFTSFCVDSNTNEILKYKQFNESKKEKFPNIKKVDIDGFTVYIGRDAKSNDHLTFNVSNPEDMWFHVKGKPGSHVVIKIKDVLPTKEVIRLVAELAKKNSKSDKSEKVTVVYCKRKFVKKEPGMNDGQVKLDHINSYEILV